MKTTKFFNLLLLAVLCLGFASCSDDDDNGKDSANIVGTWEFELDNEVFEIESNNEAFSDACKNYLEKNCPPLIAGDFSFTNDNKCETNLISIFCTQVGGCVYNDVFFIVDSVGKFAHTRSEYDYNYMDSTLTILYPNKSVEKYKFTVLIERNKATFVENITFTDIGCVIALNRSLEGLNSNDIKITKSRIIRTAIRK